MTSLTSNLLLLVFAVLDTGHEDGGLVGEDQAILDEVLVTSIKNSVQHALVQQEVAHPLRNNNIDLVIRKHNLLHLALEESDLVRHAVALDDLAGLVDDGRHVDANDVLSTCLYGEPEPVVSVTARVF